MATLRDLGQSLMARNLAVHKVVAALNDVLKFVAKVTGANDVCLAKEPSVTMVNQWQMEMGPVTSVLAAKTFVEGGGKQINFVNDTGTTLGGFDHMACKVWTS
jgi:hypothetical protein